MTDRSRLGWWGLGAIVVAGLGLLIVWPLIELLEVAAEQLVGPGIGDAGISGEAARNTLLVGVGAAGLALALGTAGALLTERVDVVGRRWLRLGIVLPVLVPPFVSALSWMRAYGPGGLTDDVLGIRLSGLQGPLGVVVVVAVNAMPLAYVIAVSSLRSRSGRDGELAARISGASRWLATRTVTVPLMAPSLVGAGALVFVVGVNAFGVPAILGTPASFDTVTTRIYQDLTLSARPESFGRAVLLATGLVVVAVAVVLVAEALLGATGRGRPTATAQAVTPPVGRRRMLPAVVAWGVIALISVLPLVALVLTSITRGVGLPPTPDNWTLENFREVTEPRLLGALGRSVLLAVAAATGAMLLGSAVAALRRRRRRRVTGGAVLLGFAIPGSTLAVAMILAYGRPLRDTLLLILLAYLAKLWAVGHRTIDGAADGLAPDLVHAARGSGASASVALRTVVAPMLRPALVGAWLLVFVIAFHELTMSSLLYGPGTETVAVAVLNLQQLGDVPASSALAVILTLPLLLVALPIASAGRLPRHLAGPR